MSEVLLTEGGNLETSAGTVCSVFQMIAYLILFFLTRICIVVVYYTCYIYLIYNSRA